MRFTGRTAVVTGAASGIGAATARRLAADGAAVVLVDTNEDLLRQVVAEIGGRVDLVVGSVADELTWATVAERAHSAFGAVDILHSNAYVHVPGGPGQLTLSDWHRVMDVNVTSAFLAIRTFQDDLVARRGSVVLTSSVHALFGIPSYTAYAASKGAIVSLGQQLAAELAPHVRVNMVLPGPVATGAFPPGTDLTIAERSTALGRVGRADEVASVIAFLASDEASFMTGASVHVDGGFSITKESL